MFAEEWIGRSEAWNKAAASGKVIGVGAPIEGATEGWYVPRYLVEGEDAKAPKLKTIADLGQYAELFRDPEEPGKGRFHNCPAGWTCELENTQMLKSYGLADRYTNFRPGTGPALDAAIVSATKRKQPILTYYWSPTPLLGRVDLVQLRPRDGEEKRIQVQAGLSKPFHDGAPELVAVLSRVNVPIELLNSTLAQQAEAKQDAPTTAKALLKAHPELWQAWVTDAAARNKIQAAL
ncbi:glycine betaine/proline transport system substrate-binding protein [Pseudomonas psychrotolerans]|nr:glycine betaine/proline transport system substrate-binding protein [Pseudomonas psychrotolerans]